MATNQILPFGLGASANVYAYADWLALSARTSGFGSGKASSEAANTAWRQAGYMACVLAQFISDNASVDVLDNGDYATVEANLKRAIQFLGQAGAESYAADTGAVNALVVTLSPAPTALTDGMVIRVKPANTNTGATTINVNGLGALPILSAAGTALISGEMIAGYPAEMIYSATSASFFLVSNASIISSRGLSGYGTAGTYTFTASKTGWYWVDVYGGGGGAGAHIYSGTAVDNGEGGGGGGYSGRWVFLTAGATVSVTVGAYGSSNSSGTGTAGGTSSFGTYCSATGGGAGTSSGTPGTGGIGVGGQINLSGQTGADGAATTDVYNAAGGDAAGPHGGKGALTGTTSATWPGGGGSCQITTGGLGACTNGAVGGVYVWY